MSWLTIASVILNAIVVPLLPWLGRKLTKRHQDVKRIAATARIISEGVMIIEAAIEREKITPSQPGHVITSRIKRSGFAARATVDSARSLAARFLRDPDLPKNTFREDTLQ